MPTNFTIANLTNFYIETISPKCVNDIENCEFAGDLFEFWMYTSWFCTGCSMAPQARWALSEIRLEFRVIPRLFFLDIGSCLEHEFEWQWLLLKLTIKCVPTEEMGISWNLCKGGGAVVWKIGRRFTSLASPSQLWTLTFLKCLIWNLEGAHHIVYSNHSNLIYWSNWQQYSSNCGSESTKLCGWVEPMG